MLDLTTQLALITVPPLTDVSVFLSNFQVPPTSFQLSTLSVAP